MANKLYIIAISFLILTFPCSALAGPQTEWHEKERCPVCGMFVSKYRPWLAQIQLESGKTVFFDGVKDMLAYYFEPEKYKGDSSPAEVYVTDYYTQKWIDGRTSFYVTGSDVLGPMGHELIPFSSLDAAENFKKDHKGDKILSFAEITLDEVNRLRSAMSGHKMKMGK